MRLRYLFPLIYLLGSFTEGSNTQRNQSCTSKENCGQVPHVTSQFLHCVGLPSTDTGKDHMRRLKGILEAMMDVYTFMRSSMTGVPLLSLQGELQLNQKVDPLQNEALVHMWLEVKMKPLLKSITKHFLSCLSTKNFSCSTYQMVVKELSHHYSEMNPVRKKWIYTFFMYPFLSGDRVAGCVNPNETSEEWLMKNFGTFRAMARMKDFSALNMVFSGLEVLHLLSPQQKAELLLSPEVVSLDNSTLVLVFHSMMTGGSGPPRTASPGWGQNWTSPGYSSVSHSYSPLTMYGPSQVSPHNGLRQVADSFTMVFRPIRSLVHEFVSFTNERDVSEVKITTLTQFLLNWTLAEVADMYRPKNTPLPSETPEFNVTNVEDWYQYVVMPLLRRFLPRGADLMHQNIKRAFHQVFYLDNNLDNETSVIQDVCSITLDRNPCGLTDVVENVARVLHCAVQTNLTVTDNTIMRLILELTERLNLLIKELSTVNFKELAEEIQQIFTEVESPSLTREHLEDPNFIKQWFSIKLLPLLPDIHPDLLECLSTKNFSCPVYQTIVAALSNHMRFLDAPLMYSQNIYMHFIYPFLLHNTSGPRCLSNSSEWLKDNFGSFSKFASVIDFYKLNPHFLGLDVLPLLTPKQLAEMLLLPLPAPPKKDKVISEVFHFLTSESFRGGKFQDVLHYLVKLAPKVNPPCQYFTYIFTELYGSIPSLSPHLEPFAWATIDDLITIAPAACLPKNVTCPVTQLNRTRICRETDSSDLQSYLSTSVQVPCNFTLEKYACAQLENFTTNQLASLLKCDLPGNSSHSRVLWQILLSNLSSVLDPALDILANMSLAMMSPSAAEILDAIGEIRVSLLTDEQLMNRSVIRLWFSRRLRGFLPSASGRFLHCLSSRNLSCHSYQQILQVFIQQFGIMTSKQQNMVAKNFILHFLQQPHSDPGCVFAFNSSQEWLRHNFGPFSEFLSLKELLHLNPQFNPLDVLKFLTPKQSAELLLLNFTTLPEKDVIINRLFDFLILPANERKLPEFLSHLIMFLQQGNLSCSSYQLLFTRLDLATTLVSVNVASSIMYSKMSLSEYIPPGCIIYSGECNVTLTNETDICVGVNSAELQLHLDGGSMSGLFCDFSVEEFACASLSKLTAEDLAAMLKCNRSSNLSGSRPIWKLFLSKASHALDEALDLLSSMTLDPSSPELSIILDSIREVRLDTIRLASINSVDTIQLWFDYRLRPFLSAVSPDFLSCLTTKGLSCSTYQQILQILGSVRSLMTPATQMSVYTRFIRVFLTRSNTTDPSCSLHINSSQWLQMNLGAFSGLVSFADIRMIFPNFSAMEALSQLTVKQLAEVSATPGQLTSAAQVNMVMNHVPSDRLSTFFDDFSPTIMGHENMFPAAVRSGMLQVVFDRANLADHSVSDSDVELWLHNRLRPLMVEMSPMHVGPFFRILDGRSCNVEEQGVENLNQTISTLSEDTQKEVHNHIIQSLKGPTPLQCYNDSNSFYNFLEDAFLGFQFPNLTTFLSLMPPDRLHQLVNTIPPSELGEFLRRTDVVDNDTQLCVVYSNYIQTPMFLETESLPAALRQPTLSCVWPMALRSSNRSEVNVWFNSLQNYLPLLTRTLITPSVTHNASCVAFQKLVSVLGMHNYTAADFERQDVFNTIRDYLTSATVPRCYNASDPELKSTAWFAEYIGPFMPFLTLEDLQTFGSSEVIQVFTVNPLNIALLNHSVLPLNLTNYYTELIYQQDSNFSPLLLPLLCRCVAPGPAFTQLTAAESMTVLHNLTTLCTDLDPQVAAALASNFGDIIDATTLSVLGSQSSGLSIGQLLTISPQILADSLSTLSSVTDWRLGQASAIIQALMASGMMQINSTSSLLILGSLVVGLPSNVFSGISGSELIKASQSLSLVQHLASTPQTVKESFVVSIISVNTSSKAILQNVPDELASEIPRVLLLDFSSNNIKSLNQKEWKREQVELFFNVIATESATTVLGGPNNLSSSVLQGFTCTGVRAIQQAQIKTLIRAYRRTGSDKVPLMETQLTCMYNLIRGDPDVTRFDLYSPDLLLYYDYSLVPEASCRSYFEQLSEADFFVFSSALSYKRTTLFDNARSCLGITNTSLTEDNIAVLGNMCCTLDGSYIQNSQPSILEKLKTCSDLTDSQVAAVETLLLSGNTQYGDPATWTEETLKDLEILPLYLTSTFYGNFDKGTKQNFLRFFLPALRRNRVSRLKIRSLKNEVEESIKMRSKRFTVTNCTIGEITQVTIADQAFPFDYSDIRQFNCCLMPVTVKRNMDSIAEKVDDIDKLRIVLNKLIEAFSFSTIPEDQVQNLGPVSRVATIEDIQQWTITEVDTLAALMMSSGEPWEPSQVKAIISKYLSKEGNTLSFAELNAIGGTNLCHLDINVLRNISRQSLRQASAPDLTNCTTEKQRVLFNIFTEPISRNTRSITALSAEEYQLTQRYLGGADLTYIQRVAVSNVSMDLATFTSLDENVVLNLTVNEVKDLLGTNLPDLKSYENETLVRSWTSIQLQSELDRLGVGLMGGRVDPTASTNSTAPTAPPVSNPTAATTANSSSAINTAATVATVAPPGTAVTSASATTAGSGASTANSPTTTGDGARIRADAGFSILVLVALLITSLTAV